MSVEELRFIQQKIESLSPTQQRIYELIEERGGLSRQDLIELTGIGSKYINREVDPIIALNLIEKEKIGRTVHYFIKMLPVVDSETSRKQAVEEPMAFTHLKRRTNRKDYYVKVIKKRWKETEQPTSRKDLQKETGTCCSDSSEVLHPAVASGELHKFTKQGQVYYQPTGHEPKAEEQFTEIDLWVQKIPPLDAFLKMRKYEEGASEKSNAQYGYKITDFYRFLSKGKGYYEIRRIETIMKKDIRNYIMYLTDKKKVKASTKRNHIAILKSYFKFAKDEGYITIDPAEGIKSPKPNEPEKTWVDRADFKALMKVATDSTDKMVLHYALFTGARANEIAEANLEDIRWKTSEIWIPDENAKTGSRHIRIEQSEVLIMLKTYIEKHRKPQDPEESAIFINSVGTRLKDQIIRDRIKKLREKAGIKKRLTPHSFRRAFARMLYEQGVPIAVIQKLLGHKHIQTTIDYIGVDEKFVNDWYDKGSGKMIRDFLNGATTPAPTRHIEPMDVPIK